MDDQIGVYLQRRADANDPIAMTDLGVYLRDDKQDNDGALEWWNKAAALGHADAHFQLSLAYFEGKMVPKDETKEKYHLEEAAIRGHEIARGNLALYEDERDNHDRAVRHAMIAASQGHDGALDSIRDWCADGIVTKEQLSEALRAHQAAVDAMRSEQRDMAPVYDARVKQQSESAFRFINMRL
jgi:hypothetical protein